MFAIKIKHDKSVQLLSFTKSQYCISLPSPFYKRRYDIINNTTITKKVKVFMKSSDSSLSCLRLLMAPSCHAEADKTQDEDAHTYTQQCPLYCLQHINAGEQLLLKHVCRFLIQHSRLVTETSRETEWLIIMRVSSRNCKPAPFFSLLISPHSAKQGGIWCSPWLSSTPCREKFICWYWCKFEALTYSK